MAEHARPAVAFASLAVACYFVIKRRRASSKIDPAKLAAAAENVTETIKDLASEGELPPSQAWQGALCSLTDHVAVFRRLLAKDRGLSAELLLDHDDALHDPPSPLNELEDRICMELGRHIFTCQRPSAISFPSLSPTDYT
jgi:hypothetical protein